MWFSHIMSGKLLGQEEPAGVSSRFFHDFRFEFHAPEPVDAAVDVVTVHRLHKTDAAYFGAGLDRLRAAFHLQVTDYRDVSTVVQDVTDGVPRHRGCFFRHI